MTKTLLNELNDIAADHGFKRIGENIYDNALSGRCGFDIDIDEEIWDEIYTDIGKTAIKEIVKYLFDEVKKENI